MILPTQSFLYPILTILILSIVSCGTDPGPAFVPDFEILSNQVGDHDDFGEGIENSVWRSSSEGFFDNRDNDPEFTDIYPAIRNNDIIFSHEFEYNNQEIRKAEIFFRTFSIQDGDPGEVGTFSDLKLYLDNIEIEEAFDDVDQFYLVDGDRGSIAGNVTITIPEYAYSILLDGKTDVKLVLDPGEGDAYCLTPLPLIILPSG